MAEPFIAEVRIFAFNFAPRGWAFCDGQLLPIAQNTALFALIGTLYGGDGRTTFGLPNLKGRAALHPGNGPGLSPYNLAQRGGVEKVTLSTSQIDSHTHTLRCVEEIGEQGSLTNTVSISRSSGGQLFQTDARANLVNMLAASLPDAGGSQAHNNLEPILTLNFCIALQGIFPSRS